MRVLKTGDGLAAGVMRALDRISPAFRWAVMGRALSLAGLLALCGCGITGGVSANLRSVDPAEKIPGIKQAAARNDRTALPELVATLESSDPAERMFAIEALQRMTKQTLGYRYYDSADARAPSVQLWKEWLATQPRR